MQSILEQVDNYVIVIDNVGMVKYFNGKALNKLCFNLSHIENIHINDIVTNESSNLLKELSYESGKDIRLTFIDVEGDEVLLNGYIVLSKFDENDAIYLILKDVKNKAYTLEHLENYLDSIPMFAFITDLEGKYIFTNKEYAAQLNYKKDDIIGKTKYDIWKDEIHNVDFMSCGERAIKSKKPQFIETEVTLNNQKRYFEIYRAPIFDGEGNVIYTIGLTRDITLNKMVEKQVQDAKNRLSTIDNIINLPKEGLEIDKVLDNIAKEINYRLNSDGISIFMYEDLQEYGVLNLVSSNGIATEIRKNFDIDTLCVDKEEFFKFIFELPKNKYCVSTSISKIQQYLKYYDKKLGCCKSYPIIINREFYGLINVSYLNGNSLYLDQDNFMKTICNQIAMIIRDNRLMMDAKNSEIHRRLLEEMIKMETMKNEFFANISHEFKTPLNIILGTAQLLDSKLKDDDTYVCYSKEYLQKYVKSLKQNSYRLLRLVNNLIDISKIESGYLELNIGNYDIVKIIEDITLSVAQYIEDNNRKLIFDTNVEERLMACDPDKIERIMLNLLSNAIKHTNDNDEILVNINIVDDKLRLSVKDTGHGIAEDKLQIIFERFRQVDEVLIRRSEGSGIGLSLVKSLVELHNGNVYVESEEGKGAEFIIEIPIYLAENINTKSRGKLYEQSKIEKCSIEFSDIYSL